MTTAGYIYREGSTRRTLPIFRLPDNKELWELGIKTNWGELEDVLKPLVSEDFWVEGPEEDAFIDDVRGQFDRSKSIQGNGVVHNMVINLGGDNAALLQQVLSLGIDPDLPNNDNWRPSHVCGSYARPKSAAVIAACRPDTSQKNLNSCTPVDAAKANYPADGTLVPHGKRYRPIVALIFEKLARKGPKTVAQLAYREKWWAVRNLVRRKVVPEEEMSRKFEGRDAMEWANYHENRGMARELDFYFNFRKKLFPLTQIVVALHASESFHSIKHAFGEAIVQLEPVKALAGKTETSVWQKKQKPPEWDERFLDGTVGQERPLQNVEILKRLESMENKFKLLEKENENLKAENKTRAAEVQSLKENQVKNELELKNKMDQLFKKLFENVGESEGEFGTKEGSLQGVRKNMEETVVKFMENHKSQQRKELKSTLKELEEGMKALEDELDSFRSEAKKKFQGLGKELENLKKGGESESLKDEGFEG